jgi:hypothetical protein
MTRYQPRRREPDWQFNPLYLLGFVGFVSLLLGVGILIYFVVQQARWNDAETTVATVVSAQPDADDRRIIRYTYQYVDSNAQLQFYTGEADVTGSDLEAVPVGSTIEILYLPNDVETSRPKQVSPLPPITLPGGAALLCGGLLFIMIPVGLAVSRRF